MPETGVEDAQAERQSLRFLLLYALAVAGGAVAYVPFLTILLPVRIEAMAGAESVAWLAYLAFAGAIAASVANIGFGWLSDILRGRKPLIMAGLFLSSALLVALTAAATLELLLGLLILWQLALNMMLSPLAAWAGDTVPDHQKGMLGGLLAFAPAMGALSGAVVTLPGWIEADMRMIVVAVLVVLCVLPVMIWGKPSAFPQLMQPNEIKAGDEEHSRPRRIVVRMWAARLLVQIAEAALFAYLYLWLRSIDPRIADSHAAQVFFLVLLMTAPVSLLVGRWTDRNDRPILPLGIAAAISALALLAMALAPNLVLALAGYAAFGLASHVFLSLHSAQTLRVLPQPKTRGRDLGIFNLTNTIPSPIMSVLTLMLVPIFGFSGLFFLLAGLAGLAAIILLSARPVGQTSQIGA
ncbi:MFS transporter [Aurantiacibacter sp. D1-12]|uniref:MFS transporter n=1 Tax=Aurantiacibacter sp. D1-12 TaxID=2993658 RepID=UPI00237C93FC|nr:MFS transporter [Aurantiacibacter sp. D1-12]MDE1467602.1 MFS transporter [Aurantiacibacter sp. D1-12]